MVSQEFNSTRRKPIAPLQLQERKSQKYAKTNPPKNAPHDSYIPIYHTDLQCRLYYPKKSKKQTQCPQLVNIYMVKAIDMTSFDTP